MYKIWPLFIVFMSQRVRKDLLEIGLEPDSTWFIQLEVLQFKCLLQSGVFSTWFPWVWCFLMYLVWGPTLQLKFTWKCSLYLKTCLSNWVGRLWTSQTIFSRSKVAFRKCGFQNFLSFSHNRDWYLSWKPPFHGSIILNRINGVLRRIVYRYSILNGTIHFYLISVSKVDYRP